MFADETRVTGRPWWEPYPLCCEPIKVQGITVNPGERLIVSWNGRKHLVPYKGWAAIPAGDYDQPAEMVGIWMNEMPTTAPPGIAGPGPGPFPLEALEHPSLLDGVIKEIDADN